MPDDRAAAFAQLYRAEYATVVAFCRNRVDDVELARDLAAETFRAIWARWDEPRRSDRAWLLGVARNLVVDEYRRRARQSGAHAPLDDESGRFADARSASGFEHADVRRALASLAPQHREVLRMHYWDDLSAGETAALLGISVGAVWVRLTRARHAFSILWNGEPHIDTITTPERTNP